MTAVDIIRSLVRFVHVVAAVSWVGGGLFYLLVLTPAFAQVMAGEGAAALRSAIGSRFRQITGYCISVLVASGTIITVDRLTDTSTPLSWGAVLVVKLLLVLAMYIVFRAMGNRAVKRRWASPENLLGLGVAVYYVTILLRLIYENHIRFGTV